MSQVSQSSNMFLGYAQGLQCIPNTIVSLIYHINKNCELWKLEDIKNILRSGNILYQSIGKRTTLLVSNVPQYIKLYNFIYHITEQNSVIGDISKEDKEFNTVPFKKVGSNNCNTQILCASDRGICCIYYTYVTGPDLFALSRAPVPV